MGITQKKSKQVAKKTTVVNDAKSTIGQAKVVNDSLAVLNAGLGGAKDKRTSSVYTAKILNPGELDAIYYANGLGAKIINIPVNDMTREWREINTPSLSPEQIQLIEQAEVAYGTRALVNEAKKWARLYGGAIIVMGIDGTGDHDEPLDLSRVQKGSLKYMHVFDRWEVSPVDINLSDPYKSNFREPEYYLLPNQKDKIHYSRVVRFDGTLVPWRLRRMNSYWNSSIFNSIYNDLRNCDIVKDSTAALVLEAKKDIIKVKDLKNMILAGQEDKIVERFALADLMKSNFNMLLLDGDEEYSQVTNGFSGLPQLVQQYLNILASISDIPATRLLGLSAPGLNSTGESEIRNYYDMISSGQANELTEQVSYMDEVLVRSTLGSMPEDHSFIWKPLWTADRETVVSTDKAEAEKHSILLDRNVVTVEEVRNELKVTDSYSNLEDAPPAPKKEEEPVPPPE